jgi:ATP-dependent Clp protease ATP-binding subunit ClpA
MNLNNFTIKAQEAIQHAFQIAQGNNQQSIETGHILKGLTHSAENVVEFLLKKLGVNTSVFLQAADKIIESIRGLPAASHTFPQRPTVYCKKRWLWLRKWATSMFR